MWHNIKNGRPVKPGIYVVAEFVGDTMVNFNPDYAYLEGYWGPNKVGWAEKFEVTHWMSYREYRDCIERIPRG